MLTSLADLRFHAERADLQLLDTIVARSTANKLAHAESLARDTIARAPKNDPEPRVPRRPVGDRMNVG